MAEKFDIGPLTWVKDEIDQALASVLDSLRALQIQIEGQTQPEEIGSLKFCQTHLYQVSGALDMVGLEGCKRFCAEIENVCAKLEQRTLAISQPVLALLTQAIESLSTYLQSLLLGMPDQPLSLYPMLQSMLQLQGEHADESELFFPDTSLRAPNNAGVNSEIESPPLSDKELSAYIAQQRALFQKSLLHWLKTKHAEGLQGMVSALANVQTVQRQPAQRTLWWSAVAFIDALPELDAQKQPNALKLCRRIDQQLNASGTGATRAIGNLLRDILFYVGTSHAVSERVAQVKALFELDELLPQSASAHTADGGSASKALGSAELQAARLLAESMDGLKNAWAAIAEKRVVDDASAQKYEALFKIFVIRFDSALQDSRQLSHEPLRLMFSAIESYYQSLVNPLLPSSDAHASKQEPHVSAYSNYQIAENQIIEVAAGLNLAEDALRHYQHISMQDSQRLSNQAQRIRNLLPTDNPDKVHVALSDEGLGQDVVQALKLQIRNALQVAEHALDQYFRDTQQIDILETVTSPLEQVAAAYEMLNLRNASALASNSLSMVNGFRQQQLAGAIDQQAQYEVLAESLSLLDLLVNELPRLRPESEKALAQLLNQLISSLPTATAGGLESPSQQTALIAEEAELVADASEAISAVIDEVLPVQESPEVTEGDMEPVADTILDSNEPDNELLDIYLGEAEEVLASIAQNIQALRLNITDLQALAEVRRGFHTLKGSGRAVGLNSVAEVAAAVEMLLNYVIEHQLATTAELIGFVERASAAFSQWVAQLRDTGRVEVEADTWQKEALALQQALIAHKPAALEEEVVIGGTLKISRALFTIFLAEAAQHIQVLQQAVVQASAALTQAVSISIPGEDSRRAAHTLASNSATAGFKAIANLARALEYWLDAHSGVWTVNSVHLYENTVQALVAMLEKAALLRQPKQVTALLSALKETTLSAEFHGQHAEAPSIEAESAQAVIEEDRRDEPVPDQAVPNEPLPDEPLFVEPAADEPNFGISILDEPELAVAESSADEMPAIAVDEDGLLLSTAFDPAELAKDEAKETASGAAFSNAAENELLLLFIEEASELTPAIGNALRAWRSEPQQLEYADELQRLLHTLKGSARMAGQSELADAVHSMEDSVIQGLKSTQPDFDSLFLHLDQLADLLESAENAGAEPTLDSGESTETAQPGRAPLRAIERTQYLRLQANVLDRLINEAGEISIARSRMDREMQGFKQSSLDLNTSILRLRAQLREMEIEAESQLQSRMALLQEANENFDPLEFDRFTRLQELTRMMAESVNDVATIQHGLLMNLDETQSALQQQQRMNRELQRGLMNVRMVPFSIVSERLQRIVRQTARELNKPAELSIEGEGVAIDRSVLDKIGAPLEHLLRNAVAHGLESRTERKKSKKNETGQIMLKVIRENDEIVITISDDGAGIPLQKVRKAAEQKGLFSKEQVVGEQALMQLIFESGFSTASKVTQIAGRGVGLDSVRSDITALGGRIDVSSVAGQGAVFTVFLPVTLSVAQVVLVRAGTRIFALPSVMVEQVQKLKPDALLACYQAQRLSWDGRDFPMHFMSALIGDAAQQAEALLYAPVLLLRSASYQIALHVDEIIGNHEVVMKPIGPQLAHVPGMIGATVMGDGSIVFILNAVQLANREQLAAGAIHVVNPAVSSQPGTDASLAEVRAPLVLVVDDSLTMRKVLGRLLEREGYRIVVAKDGMEALQLLQELRPAIILSDIEMPQMDGFELLRNIRGDALTAPIPVIFISSRTAEKHRHLAHELGVNAFLGKPVQDEELLAEISALLAK